MDNVGPGFGKNSIKVSTVVPHCNNGLWKHFRIVTVSVVFMLMTGAGGGGSIIGLLWVVLDPVAAGTLLQKILFRM